MTCTDSLVRISVFIYVNLLMRPNEYSFVLNFHNSLVMNNPNWKFTVKLNNFF